MGLSFDQLPEEGIVIEALPPFQLAGPRPSAAGRGHSTRGPQTTLRA